MLKPSRKLRGRSPRFSAEEDAMIIDMKERKRLPWKSIKKKFPNRSLASVRVHYAMKLKEGVDKRNAKEAGSLWRRLL